MAECNEHNHEHGPEQITESQLRELRCKYFTIRHPRVPECGHALDTINEPTFRNCQFCWFTFFTTHGDLVKVTHEAFSEHGPAFVDKLRGRRYRVMFTRFMSTMNRLKEEADALQEQRSRENVASPEGCDGTTTPADGTIQTVVPPGSEDVL
jgi:hypothetical protein